MRFSRPVLILLIVAACAIFRYGVGYAQGIITEWSRPIDITQPSSSDTDAFGVLLCDQYQNVHLLWSSVLENRAAIFYRNDVNGDWSTPMDVLAFSVHFAGRLRAAIDNNENVLHLVWVDQAINGNLYYSQVSLLNAHDPRSWSPPRVLAQYTGAGSIEVDSAGIIHLVYGVSDGEGLQPTAYYIRSEDGGMTWSIPVAVFSTTVSLPSSMYARIAVDDAGRLHVGLTLRSQEYGVYSEVGYVRSLDGGQTWSSYVEIDAMGTTFQGVSTLVPYAFGEDEIHLTWHDPRRMHQWSFDGGDTWSNPIEIMHLGAAFGGPNQLVKDSAGTLRVVTAVGGGVYSAAWHDAQWGLPERIDDRFIDPHGQNMIVCQGNQLHVVYYDRLGDNRVWYASRQVDAPHVERQLLPPPPPQPTVAATPDIFPSPEPTTIPDTSRPVTAIVVSPSPWFSILAGTIPAAILVVGVVITMLKRPRA